ncbi:MAG: DAK2 domain-containing protein, partial [Firmicutes bacterium]|nr:DAK2 domain-containing protein [Bacillota bacterium]
NDGIELKAALNKAVEAARVGADSTANLVGKKGRSRFLGESGVDFQDAGANSTYYLFKAMAEAVR